MDHRKILKDTKALVDAERYEEALKAYKKFFKDSTKKQSLTGVRLSYCLMDWRKLGEKYEPALKSLNELGAKTYSKVEKFLENNGDGYSKKIFTPIQELVSINQTLGKDDESIALFKRFDELNLKIAESFFITIKEALNEAGEYELCYKYIKSPDEFIFFWKDYIDRFIEFEGITPPDIQNSILEHHVEAINFYNNVLIKNEREESANEVCSELFEYLVAKGYEEKAALINGLE